MSRVLSSQSTQLSRRKFIVLSAATLGALSTRGLASNEIEKIRQDWHMHTHQAGGKPDAIVKDMIATNEAYGLDLMGISEHIDRIDQRDGFKIKAATNRNEAKAVKTKMKVMIGTESTMINPSLCAVGKEIAASLDYVMVSCNHYHLKHVENPNPGTPQAYADHYLEMLLGATELGYADTIGHPFFHNKLAKKLGMETLPKILKAYNEEKLACLLNKAAQSNMAFEINPHHADQALEWFRDLVQEARRHGTKFTLGTDAHAIASLGYPGRPGRTCLDILHDLTITDDDLKWAPMKGFKKA
jgi:histidinol phosphatase-like PHP family hydrolase